MTSGKYHESFSSKWAFLRAGFLQIDLCSLHVRPNSMNLKRTCLFAISFDINKFFVIQQDFNRYESWPFTETFNNSTTQTYRRGMHLYWTTHIEKKKILEFSFPLLVENSFMPIIHKIFPLDNHLSCEWIGSFADVDSISQ